jgi:hypothetical protein
VSLELRTELLMAIEDYESIDSEKRKNGLDITALDNESNNKVLLRVITKPKSKSGYVSVNTVDKMTTAIKNKDYDKGIIISNKFTKAAERRLSEEGIQRISDNFMPNYAIERLYFAARELVNTLCKAKCGKIPQKESDCKGHLDGGYSCKIRLISDNALFHFKRGWKSLLEDDILQLLSMHHPMND